MKLECPRCGKGWDDPTWDGRTRTVISCPECRTSIDTTALLAGAAAMDAGLSESQTEDLPYTVQTAAADPGNRFGRYIRVELLGKGGMGEVWRAWDTELRRWVALKLPRIEDASEFVLLKAEAQAAGKLSHPNVAAVYELGQAQGRHFIAMEYVNGVPLSDYPRKDRKKLVECVRQAAEGVAYAHRNGIVHRDLKPANIMVHREREQAYVMDFGIARQASTSTRTTTSVVGTPAYMSPEQAEGKRVDGRSDVWSLGVTLYELLADRIPFEAESPLKILEKVMNEEPRPLGHVDADLSTIVMKCLEKDPARRYAGSQDLADDLGRWLREEVIRARVPSLFYRLGKRLRRHKSVSLALLAAMLVISGIVSILVPKWIAESRARRRVELELKSEQARRHVEEGDARWTRQNDLDGAIACYTRAIEANPRLASAYVKRGQALRTRGEPRRVTADLEQALFDLSRAIELDPGDSTNFVLRGLTRRVSNDLRGAIADYTSALKLNSKLPEAYLNRGEPRLALGEFEDAVADFDKALQLAPADWPFRQNAARLLGIAKVKASLVPSYGRGLIGHWKFDEAQGDRAEDSSGAGHHGTLVKNPARVPGKLGGALAFNGTDTYVEVPDTTALNPACLTLAAWVHVPSYSSQTANIAAKAANQGWRVRVAVGGELDFIDRGFTNTLSIAPAVPLRQWTHVVATGDSDGLRLYVNGILAASNATPFGGTKTSRPLKIGGDSETGFIDFFNGCLDEVRLYDRALSPVEVRSLFDADGEEARMPTGAGSEQAKAVLGRQLCFERENWEKGLRLLAAGADGALSSAAVHDLAGAQTASGMVAIGDQWTDLISRFPEHRQALLERASKWYLQAWQGLDDPSRADLRRALEGLYAPLAPGNPRGLPAGWGGPVDGKSKAEVLPTKVHSGGLAARLTPPPTKGLSSVLRSSTVRIPPKARIDVVAWILADATDSLSDNFVFHITDGSGKLLASLPLQFKPDVPVWVKVAGALTAPEAAYKGSLDFVLGAGKGHVWVDDVRILADGKDLLPGGGFEP